MKLAHVLEAIDALYEARIALAVGGVSIPEQINISGRCSIAAIRLRADVEMEFPNVKIEDDQS